MLLNRKILSWVALMGLAHGYAMSPRSADVYDSSGLQSEQRGVRIGGAYFSLGQKWTLPMLLEHIQSDSILETLAIGPGAKTGIPDADSLVRVLRDQSGRYERIDFIYKQRFSDAEKEFVHSEIIAVTLVVSLIELRHPFHAKHPEPYNWWMPAYGLLGSTGLFVAMTYSHEKRRIYLKWR